MNIIATIHDEIDQVSDRRAESGTGFRRAVIPSSSLRSRQLDAKLDALWDAHRAMRARIRFGEREQIVKRARAEERLSERP